MISELSFLIDLLLNHKLSKVTKDLITARIKEIEELRNLKSVYIPESAITLKDLQVPGYIQQAPSTLANLEKHELPIPDAPVTQVAQTMATAQAMDSRQQAIEAARKGVVDPRTGGKRKF